MRSHVWFIVGLAWSGLACPARDEAPAADDDDGTTSSSGGSSDVTGSASSGEESGSSTAAEPPANAARALEVTLVEANSGVAIAIAQGGEAIAVADRNAPLPRLRNTAVRVHVDVDESVWVARPIEARLTIGQSDGRASTYKETIEVEGDSTADAFESTFLFGVLADDMNPEATFQVELFEAGTDYDSLPEATSVPMAVFAGPAPLGVEPSRQVMRVTLVPIDYRFGGCEAVVDTSVEAIAKYEEAMFQHNPVEALELEVREPYLIDDLDLATQAGFFNLLNRIGDVRAADAPDPNVYYFALFDNCGQCIGEGGCLLGLAPAAPGGSIDDAAMRVAIGTQFLGATEVGIDTFVHEIGHTQGRKHVKCPAAAALNADSSYPHEDGTIGTWGFGVRDFTVRHAADHYDYMSYCNPTWVSDYQWKATFERIRELSSWEVGAAAPGGEFVLVGMLDPRTGESTWFTDRGSLAQHRTDAGYEIEFRSAGTLVARQRAVVDAWTEGPRLTLRVPLVPGFDVEVDEIEVRTPHGVFGPIVRAQIHRHHLRFVTGR